MENQNPTPTPPLSLAEKLKAARLKEQEARVQQAAQKAATTPPPEKDSLWQKAKQWWSGEGVVEEGRAAKAFGTGMVMGLNNASDLAMLAGREVVQHTPGLKQLAGDEFHEMADIPIEQYNPLRFDSVEEHREEGAYRAIQSLGELATGLAITAGAGAVTSGVAKAGGLLANTGAKVGAKVAESAVGKAGKAVAATKAGGRAVKAAKVGWDGVTAEMIAMDPHEERLANEAAKLPAWLGGPIFELMAQDDEDGEIEARIKMGFEGMLSNAAIHGVILSAKLARHKLRGGLEGVGGALSKADLKLKLDEELRTGKERIKAEEMDQQAGPVRTKLRDDGSVDVIIHSPDGNSTAKANFKNPAEADEYAASMRWKHQRHSKPMIDQPEEFKTRVAEAERLIEAGLAPEKAFDEALGANFNHLHIRNSEQAKDFMNMVSNASETELRDLRARRIDGYEKRKWPKRFAEVRNAVRRGGYRNIVEALKGAARASDNIDRTILAGRIAIQAVARDYVDVARKAALRPDNKFFEEEMDGLLDLMWEIETGLAPTISNTAAGTAVNRMVVDEKMADEVRKANRDYTHRQNTRETGGVMGDGTAKSASEFDEAMAAGEVPISGKPAKEPKAPRGRKAPEDEVDLTRAGETNVPGTGERKIRVMDPNLPARIQMTKAEKLAFARQILWTDGDPSAVLDAMRGTKIMRALAEEAEEPHQWWNILKFTDSDWRARQVRWALAVRVNNMLSKPTTMVVNAVSGAYMSVLQPFEDIIGGAIGATRGAVGRAVGIDTDANGDLAKVGAIKLWSYAMDLQDGMRGLKRAIQTGEYGEGDIYQAVKRALTEQKNTLDPVNLMIERPEYASSVGFLGLWGIPTKVLGATDEFWKTTMYRSHVRAQSVMQSAKDGLSFKDMAAIRARMDEDLAMSFDMIGGATNPAALQYARYGTFTDDPGKLGQWIMEGGNFPLINLIMPFRRTPMRIMSSVHERTPLLNVLKKSWRDDFAAGGMRRDQALARFAVGGSMYSMAFLLATSGKLRGSGQADRRLHAQGREAGIPSNSIKLGDNWVDLSRLEPFGTILSMTADLYEMSGELSDEEATGLMSGILSVVARATVDRSMLLGTVDFFDAVSEDDSEYMDRFIRNTIGSFLPNAVRSLNTDPHVREVRSWMDEIRSRLPGFSTTLEPRQDIFGNPRLKEPSYFMRNLNPFPWREHPDPSVQTYLFEMGKSVSLPSYKIGERDLRDRDAWNEDPSGESPYYFMRRRMGEVELKWKGVPGKLTMEEAIQKIVVDNWDDLSKGNAEFKGGQAHTIAQTIIDRYEQAARAELVTSGQYPKLVKWMGTQNLAEMEAWAGRELPSVRRQLRKQFNDLGVDIDL